MDQLTIGASYARALVARLALVLPSRTGSSLAEVELSMLFIAVTNLILKNCRAQDPRSPPGFMLDIVCALVDLLSDLNIDATSGKLLERDEKAVLSTLIASKVLKIALLVNWSPEALGEDEFDEPLNHCGIGSSSAPDIRGDSFEVYTFPVPAALNIDIHAALEVLLTIVSSAVNYQTVLLLRTQPQGLEDAPAPPPDRSRVHALEIDANILLALKYLAACNASQYCLFLHHKLFSWAERGEHIPTSTLQKYSHLLMHVYFTADVAGTYIRSVYSTIPYIRSPTWMQLFLYYGSWSLRYQLIYRPGFYAQMVYPGSQVDQACRGHFDYVTTVLDDAVLPQSLLLWLVLMCPSDFNVLLHPGKLKTSSNKRVRFLHSITKDALSGTSLDKFESMANILLLGSVLCDVRDGVREFSERYLDDVYIHVRSLRSLYDNTPNCERYGALVVRFMTYAIVMRPEKYIPLFRQSLEDARVLIRAGNREPKRLAEFFNHLAAVETLSKTPVYRAPFVALMATLAPILKGILASVCYYLEQYYRLHSPEDDEQRIVALQLKRFNVGPPLCAVPEHHSAFDTPHKVNITLVDSDYTREFMATIEHLLEMILNAFAAAPQFFLDAYPDSSAHMSVAHMSEYVRRAIAPITLAVRFKLCDDSNDCFEAAYNLACKLLHPSTGETFSAERQRLSFLISIHMVHAVLDALITRPAAKFQQCFILFNWFLHEHNRTFWKVSHNANFAALPAHSACRGAAHAYEVLLLNAICNHDVEFFKLAKSSMRYYVRDLLMSYHNAQCRANTLVATFERIIDDRTVSLGYASLHKKLRAILVDAEPSDSLCHTWLLIYQRWRTLAGDALAGDSSMLRHYTGFLLCTAGCFVNPAFLHDTARGAFVLEQIDACLDLLVRLLVLGDPAARAVVKDALAAETHQAFYAQVCDKLCAVVQEHVTRGTLDTDAVTFVEEAASVFTSMVGSRGDGAFAAVGALPRMTYALVECLPMVRSATDQARLKLRVCKLGIAIESDYDHLGLTAAHKFRNFVAKTISGWLDDTLFGVTLSDALERSSDEVSFTDASTRTDSSTRTETTARTPEDESLRMDFASECLRCLALLLHALVLDIPDGTKESNLEHARNLVFSWYFTLFVKVLQRLTADAPAPRHKYKVQGILDNVLAAFSNVLRSNSNIGMPFALPLCCHENKKIRTIFLDIFATMLSSRKQQLAEEEFPDAQIAALADAHEVFSAAAAVASPSEHNLLAASLNGLFAHTKRLDRLFQNLLEDELEHVTRTSDIFRGNSCLTRLMSILAKEYGLPFITVVLRPFVMELVEHDISVEVEKSGPEADVTVFIGLLRQLVDAIVDLEPFVPDAFRFICGQIYRAIERKFGDARLIAVGLFIFLRFICPVIVSPESSFDIPAPPPRVKRLLMQIVKVIQYMANGSLANLRWAKLALHMDAMDDLNQRIFGFLERIALLPRSTRYPFLSSSRKPYTSLRYLHKFLYTYFPAVRARYLSEPRLVATDELRRKISVWRKLDTTLQRFGAPRFSISLQGAKSVRPSDSANIGTSQFAEFMAKMSARNMGMSMNTTAVYTSVFHDGTPVVMVNFRRVVDIGCDINTFVYMLFEVAGQVWDNKFYCIMDVTRFFFFGILGKSFYSLIVNYAPSVFFTNCARIYYYNLPRQTMLEPVERIMRWRQQENDRTRTYFYSQQDDPELISALCLEEDVVGINLDVRVVYKNCHLLDDASGALVPVTLKFGRKWLQLCFDRVPYEAETVATKTIAPVETHMISDLIKCEVSHLSGAENEFTVSLNAYSHHLTLVSPQRQEILRLLYFAMLRCPKDLKPAAVDDDQAIVRRFNALAILAFHGLLECDNEVRAAAARLLLALDAYLDLGLGMSTNTSMVTFPIDTTDIVVAALRHLAALRPAYTYDFVKEFFASFGKLPRDAQLSGILYIVPWLDNLGAHVLTAGDGVEKMASFVRLFCRMTVQHRALAPVLKDMVWKRLFNEMAIMHILVEEMVLFAIDNIADADAWCPLMAMVTPSMELCGEFIARIHTCIAQACSHDAEIVTQSKQLEITVLVKVCGLLLFNSYLYAQVFLPDVVLFCTLFIDTPGLEFGADLQKLVIHTLRAFAQKPGFSPRQTALIDSTVDYFSSPRAKILFGFTSKDRVAPFDPVHYFNRAVALDLLCDTLHDFLCQMGSGGETRAWLLRWSSLLMDIAFSSLLYQRRALIVVCTLARAGVSDSSCGRLLRLVSRMLLRDSALEFLSALCCSRLNQGLAHDSMYLPLLAWQFYCSVFVVSSATYQVLVHCLGNMLRHVDGAFLRLMQQHRKALEPGLSEYERRIGLVLHARNFEPAMLYLLCWGLTAPHFQHQTVGTLVTVLGHCFGETETAREVTEGVKEGAKGKAKNEVVAKEKGKSEESADSLKYYYLLVLFLATPPASFRSHLLDLALDLPCTNIGADEIPTVLLDVITADNVHARYVMALLAHIFCGDSDQTYKCRFVDFYCHVFRHLRETAFRVFHIVREELENNIITSTREDAVSEISHLLVRMIGDTNYSEQKSRAEVDVVLRHFDFCSIDHTGKFLSTNKPRGISAATRVLGQTMYQSFCNVPEGLRLHNF